MIPDGASQAVAVFAQTFGCGNDLADVLVAKGRTRAWPPRATIVESLGANTAVFLMIDGHAHALALSVDGRLVLVETFGKGAIFGEASLIGDSRSEHEVAAVDHVQASQFAAQTFVALMENYSCIALTMSRVLTARLQETTRQMVEIATLSAPGRIHAELLRQARATPGMAITPAPVLSEFALTVRSTRETVSRTISLLEKRGIIRRDKNALTIVAPHRLEELVY